MMSTVSLDACCEAGIDTGDVTEPLLGACDMESTLSFTRANPWDPTSCDECTLTKNILAPDETVFASTSENVDQQQCCDQGEKDHDFSLKAACLDTHSIFIPHFHFGHTHTHGKETLPEKDK